MLKHQLTHECGANTMIVLLALAFAALAATATATGYDDGKEYVYSYSGQVYSGFPRIKEQYAGQAFKADLRIQPHGNSAIFKVENVKKAQFNGEIHDIIHHEYDYSDLPEVANFLTQPFKVYREKGKISHFETAKGEPAFSVNVKRAMIGLFNLNFDEEHQASDQNELDVAKPEQERHYYKLYEDGVLGNCETAYVIEHHPVEHHHNIVLNVTKVRNYHKCKSSPNQVYAVFHGHECGEAEHEKSHTLHGNAHVHYDIRGYRHHYVIEKISSIGEVAYTPYPVEGQTVATYTNRFLVLKDEHPVTEEIPFGEGENHDSLEYKFSFAHDFKDPVDLKKPHFLFNVFGKKVPLDVVKRQFEELVHVYDDPTYHEKVKDKNFPAKFVELLRSVATLDYDDIEALYKQYADIPKTGYTEQQKLYRNLFVDTLVASGTNPAFHFGTYLVENKKVSPKEAAYFVKQFQLHVKEVSQTLLDEFEELCFHDAVTKHKSLHVDCLLSFSNVIYDHCVARYHPEVPFSTDKEHCQPTDAIKYFENVAKHYQEASDEGLKAAYISVLGNIGLVEILPYLRPYIEGATHAHQYFRSNGLWAVKKVGFRFPDKVRDLLIPLLFNHTENYELRLGAFNILLMYRPSLYELEGVARALKQEPDDQVKSYIYSTFTHLANSTHPCDRKISKDAHYVLHLLDDVKHEFEKYDYSYSHHYYAGGYDHDYDFGGSTRLAYYASDDGWFPRSAYFGTEDFLGGKSFQSFGLGFQQHGIEKLFDRFFGPHGSVGERSLFDLFKKRAKRDASGVEKELDEIKSKLHLPVFDYHHMHGDVFFTYMGNKISFTHFDDKTFEGFFKEGRFSIPEMLPAAYQKIGAFHYQRFMLTIDKFYIIPLESGLPLVFDYKQPIHFHHHNKESGFKVEPGFFPEDRAGKWPDHVKFETDGHISADKNLFASMGVVFPIDQIMFGAGINRRSTVSLPLKMKFDLDEKEHKLTHTWTPVAPHEVYHFKYEPYTFVDSYANAVPKSLEEGYLPVKRLSQKDFHKSYLHDAFGFGFDVSGHYENDFDHKGNFYDFIFEKDYREKFYYLYANPNFEPYYTDVEFTQPKEGATKEVVATFDYHFFEGDHPQEGFSSAGFEDFHEQGKRAPLCTSQVEAEFVAHGDKERKAHATLAWTKDLQRKYHKVNFFYDRTPFTHDETENFKICGSSFYKFPEYNLAKFATLDTIGMDHTVKSGLKLHFGKDCTTDSKITVEGAFKTTDEQREYEAKREVEDTVEHYNPYAHAYQECLKERKKGLNYGEHCIEYFELITTLHHYDLHVKYENLHDRFLNCTYKAGRFLRHLMFFHGDHNLLNVHNPENEIHMHVNFSLHLPLADYRVSKPHSVSHYTNVYRPHYMAFDSYPDYEDIHIKNSFSDIFCKLEGDHVHTFDKFEYTLPPIDCYKVIAKDCSKFEHFTVLGSKIKHPKYQKSVKIFLGDHKIEALPVSDDSDIIVRVDGKRVDVTDDSPYLHHDDKDPQDIDFYLTHRTFYYALHSEKYGLIVEYDGHNIIVQASPYYRSKLCGLCGNYNGQKYDGMEDEHGCYYEDSDAYAYAFAIPTETCQVPKVEKKCINEGCTKLRTKVVERSTGKTQETCFSTEPVAICAPHCKATGSISKSVSFHCLPSNQDSTKTLVRQSQFRPIHEIRRKSKDLEATVDIPDDCLKN